MMLPQVRSYHHYRENRHRVPQLGGSARIPFVEEQQQAARSQSRNALAEDLILQAWPYLVEHKEHGDQIECTGELVGPASRVHLVDRHPVTESATCNPHCKLAHFGVGLDLGDCRTGWQSCTA
jgi:hypothetical protein